MTDLNNWEEELYKILPIILDSKSLPIQIGGLRFTAQQGAKFELEGFAINWENSELVTFIKSLLQAQRERDAKVASNLVKHWEKNGWPKGDPQQLKSIVFLIYDEILTPTPNEKPEDN